MKTKKIFEKYGQRAVLSIGGITVKNQNFKAFIQPLRYKNKLYLRGKFTEIGKNREDYYLYMGPPDVDISSVDGIKTHLYIDEKEYLVYRTERHTVMSQTVYFWAIIRPVVADYENDSSGDCEEEAAG